MYRVLILGCGNIAGGFDAERGDDTLPRTHAGAYARHPDFEVVACVDPDDDRRTAFQARWRVAEGGRDIAALGATPGAFDVISICSPTALHPEHLAAAIALRPRLIFCEKALTPGVDESKRIVDQCDAANIRLAVNYTRRWAPDIVRLGEALRSGAWGKVRSATGTYTKGIVHNGGHLVDLLHLLLGPMRLIAAGAPRFDFWEDDPSVPALLESADGVPVQFAIGHAADYALFELVLITSDAEIVMRDGGLRWAIRRRGPSAAFAGYQTLDDVEMLAGEYDHAMSAAVANLAAALHDGAPLASDGISAVAAQRLCEQIRDAALSAAHVPTPQPRTLA